MVADMTSEAVAFRLLTAAIRAKRERDGDTAEVGGIAR